MIYFTDGLGIYPAKRPAYDAAFVMLAQQGFPERVPPWGSAFFWMKTNCKEIRYEYQASKTGD